MSAAPSFAEAARAVREAVALEPLAKSLGIPLVRGRGPCPICRTSRTSQAFSVRRDRYACFACGARGDAIDLVRAIRGCSSREALAELTSAAGIDPRRPISPLLRCRMALEDARRRADQHRSRRLTRLAAEACCLDRLADMDDETAAIAWRLGHVELARDIAADAIEQRDRAASMDREAERLAEDRTL